MTTPLDPPPLHITAVERDTGITKDTLRVWERRYGYPKPIRGPQGERLYPSAQVDELKLIQRLLSAGLRPGRIVGRPLAELQAMIAGRADTAVPTSPGTHCAELMTLLRSHDVEGLRQRLADLQQTLGLERFVIEVTAPLLAQVGQAWLRAELDVFEEHLIGVLIERSLQTAIATLPLPAGPLSGPRPPRVLLTTASHEPHGLGLLMVEALLVQQGCDCIALGSQTPNEDIRKAVVALSADVLAMSFSALPTRHQVLLGLQHLRRTLPEHVQLWVGGASAALTKVPPGVRLIRRLEDLAAAVTRWRALQER